MSILLSVSIFLGSLGLTVGTHYCFDQAVETRILFDLEDFGCGMARMEVNDQIKNEGDDNIGQRSCCDSKFDVADIDSDFKLQAIDHTLNLNFLTSLIVSSVDLMGPPPAEEIVPSYHSPPLIEHDIQVLFQSFLI
jgi:hypothetical protein